MLILLDVTSRRRSLRLVGAFAESKDIAGAAQR